MKREYTESWSKYIKTLENLNLNPKRHRQLVIRARRAEGISGCFFEYF